MIRKPFQGVLNIIRFNWHLYVFAIAFLTSILLITQYFENPIQIIIYTVCILIFITTIVSLLTSFYIYDLSGLYKFSWIDLQDTDKTIVNISAGFDESSAILQRKFPKSKLIVFDFYDPEKHTEISIKRARKAFLPFPNTVSVETSNLHLTNDLVDKIFVILSAHEIRNENERITFFKELRRILKPNGNIYIMEHLRDLPNFLAYNIGFFHFHSKASWLKTFHGADLHLEKEIKLTPFISTFELTKHGNTL